MKKMLFVLLAAMLVLSACAPAVTPAAHQRARRSRGYRRPG